jgi:hypothetical protein
MATARTATGPESVASEYLAATPGEILAKLGA